MPDLSGWPTLTECLSKLELSAEPSAKLIQELGFLLKAVIADFGSPCGRKNDGGTGRRFTPLVATKRFDGNGYPELSVPDIVPDTDLVVKVYETPIQQVFLKTHEEGLGYNILAVRSPGVGFGFAEPYLSVFPQGVQNISVTATWGYAATVPDDVFDAIRCEVAYRGMVTGVIGMDGVGVELQLDDFSMSTSVGAINWAVSSPVSVFHNTYLAVVKRYRNGHEGARRNLVGRMS